MTDALTARRPARLKPGWLVLSLPLVAYLLINGRNLAEARHSLHAPDLSLLGQAPPAIQLHVAAAMIAFLIGAVLLAGVKGTRLHRMLGWTWVAAMAVTALSSLFIHRINPGGFSLIHFLSGWTLVALPMAVYAARRRRIAAHRRSMVSIFVGGLMVAGLFTFMPGRLMWAMVFG